MRKQKPLQGEELAWFELAYRLRTTVSELKEKIGLTEFQDWQEFLRMERDRNDKLHFYLAQIACEVRRSYVKHPKSVKLQEFLLRFQTPEVQEALTEGHKRHKIAMSKGAWLAGLGLKINGVNTGN